MKRVTTKGLPDEYKEETWRKKIRGVPKYKILEHYKREWKRLQPQLKDRYVTFRAFYDSEDTIIRHPPKNSGKYIKIETFDDLKQYIKQHAVEVIPELGKADDPERTREILIDLDNQGLSENELKSIARDAKERMKSLPGVKKVVVVDTGGKGYHIRGYLSKPITWNEARSMLKEKIIKPLRETYPGKTETNPQAPRKGKVFLDIASVKRHGAARAIGSLHADTLKPSKIVKI